MIQVSSYPAAAAAAPAYDAAALAEVVDYINDRLLPQTETASESTFSTRAARLDVLANRVEAQVGPFLLHTENRRITPSRGDHDLGYLASLSVRLRSGRRVAADTLPRLQLSAPALVAMDRFCRVLHMLNHLLLGREESDLWLHVSLGHVLAVEGEHGRFFEALLKQCGLGPERILLLVPALAPGHPDFSRLARSFANYRQRGYRLVLDLPQTSRSDVLATIDALAPDWVRIPHAALARAAPALWSRKVLTYGTAREPIQVGAPGVPVLAYESVYVATPRFLL